MRKTILLLATLMLACARPAEEADPCHAECNPQKPSGMTGVTCERCDGASFCQCYDPEWWTDNGEQVPGPGQLCQGIRYIGGCGPAPWKTAQAHCEVKRDAAGRVVEVWIDGEFAAAYWYDGEGHRVVFEEVPGANLAACGVET